MTKESKYIKSKTALLFDVYGQLETIKRGKAYKDGNTAAVRRRPRGGGRLCGVDGLGCRSMP